MKNLSSVLRRNPNLAMRVGKKYKKRVGKKRVGKKRGGFIGPLVGAVAPHLIKLGVDGIANLMKKKKGKGIKSTIQKYAPIIGSYIKRKGRKYAPKIKDFIKDRAVDFAVDKMKKYKSGKGLVPIGMGIKKGRRKGRVSAPHRPFKVTILKHRTIAPKKVLS